MFDSRSFSLSLALLALACGPLPSRDGGVGSAPPAEPEKIAADAGVVIGSFTSQAAAAFDDEVSQTGEEGAWTALFDADEADIYIGKEWRGPTRVRRVEVFAPSDGAFFADPQNYPDGGAGKVHLLGQKAGDAQWTIIASEPFAASNGSEPVVIDARFAKGNSGFVKHAVGFTADAGLVGLVRVAEVVFFGETVGISSIEWDAGAWVCSGVECVESENDGVLKRTVQCLRDGTHKASEALCPSEKPDTEGESCGLSCPYELVFIGYRPFGYQDSSGWLHEGRLDRRAGPLPSSTSFGTTVDDIEGKPCSILTSNPKTYFVGISCTQSPDYCAFQCR